MEAATEPVPLDMVAPRRSKDEPESSAEPVAQQARSDTDEDDGYLKGAKLFAVAAGVTATAFLIMLDISILSTAIPQITTNFHSLADVGWYTGVYQLAGASFQPLTGKFYSKFKTKWTYLVFLFIFEVGSLICALANTSATFIVGRTIAGLGSSGLTNGGLGVIAGSVPMEKRPMYTGIMIGVGQIGIISGPLIGGALTEYTSWRWCFWINLPLGGVAALVLALASIPELTPKEPFSFDLVRRVIPDLDLVGFSLFAPAAVMLLLALQFGSDRTHAWNSSVIIGLFVGAGVTAIIFILYERRVGDRAMIPGSILQNRVLWTSAGFTAFLMAAVFCASQFLPIYFQAVKGVGPTDSGVSLLPSIISQLLFVIISGVGVSKLGYYLPFVLIGSVVASIGNGLMSTLDPYASTGKWIGFQIVMGAGRGFCLQMGIVASQQALPAAQVPVALAILIMFQTFGGAISVVVATTIFTQSLLSDVQRLVPSVSAEAVLAAGGGASAVRALVPPDSPELDGLLLSYSNAVDRVFYLLASFAAVCFLFGLGMGWGDVRKKAPSPSTANPEVDEARVTGNASQDETHGSETEKAEV